MRKLHYITIVLIAIFISTKNAQAQLPVNDTAWVLQKSLSDEFDTTALRTYKWQNNYWAGHNNGAELDYAKNDSLNGSMLVIIADTLSPNKIDTDQTHLWCGYNTPGHSLTYAYQGGVIISKDTSFKYGYFEIYARYPSKKWPLWPCFWLNSSNKTTGHKFYNEIDIAENDGQGSFNGNTVGNNFYAQDDTDSCCVGPNGIAWGGQLITALASTDSLSGGFHKYAAQWDPHQFTYYFDDQPTSTHYDPTGEYIQQHAMSVIINFCVDPNYAKLPADWNGPDFHPVGPHFPTKWRQYFEIEYFRYYKLVTACTTALSVCIPSDYSARKVQQSITVGGGSCTPDFNGTNKATSYDLRATDFVLVDVGTKIEPTGTGYFAIEIIACPQ